MKAPAPLVSSFKFQVSSLILHIMKSFLSSLINRVAASVVLPLLVLATGMLSLFVFQNDRHSFQPGHHGFLSSHGMTLAAHLSADHHFLMFNRIERDAGGALRYDAYNRFPVGAFAIIRAATFPFRRDLSMQISVARNLMNVFLAIAACIACLSLYRLVANWWAAVGATLLAFSSYYCLYYNDMIFNDVPALFGVLLVFHGMVVFMQEQRYGQLLVKVCAGLFLGWQAYALLLPFTVLGCIGEWASTRSLRAALRSRFFHLGVVSLAFGGVLLACNLVNEYIAMGAPVGETSTFRKMLWRLGLAGSAAYNGMEANLGWPVFLKEQLARIGRMSIPHIVLREGAPSGMLAVFGGIVLGVSLMASAVSRQRLLAFSLVVSGLCWALPMRNFVAFHDFQSLYYVGVPLIFYGAIAGWVGRLSKLAGIGLAGIALIVFVVSCIHLNLTKAVNADTDKNVMTADFQRIVDQVGVRKDIYVEGDPLTIGGGFHSVDYYLAGNYFDTLPGRAEFVISTNRIESAALLTPDNREIFLYRKRK